MTSETPEAPMTTERLEELLQLTVLNQRIEGYELTPEEVSMVRENLRRHYNL